MALTRIIAYLNSWLLKLDFMIPDEIEQMFFVEYRAAVRLKQENSVDNQSQSRKSLTHLITSSLLVNHLVVERSQSSVNIVQVRLLHFLNREIEGHGNRE